MRTLGAGGGITGGEVALWPWELPHASARHAANTPSQGSDSRDALGEEIGAARFVGCVRRECSAVSFIVDMPVHYVVQAVPVEHVIDN